MSNVDLIRRREDVINAAGKRQKPPTPTGSRRNWGKVTSVSNGPPPSVMVRLEPGADPIGPLAYLAHGAPPAVDDYVFMINVDGDMIVIGHVAQVIADQGRLIPILADYTDNHIAGFTDLFSLATITNAAGKNFTLPPEASVDWFPGSWIEVRQGGAGQITMTAGAGVTIRSRNGLKTAGQYAIIRALYLGSNVWNLSWDTTP